MVWQNKELNKYPEIILSDCSISSIYLETNKIIVDFSKYGFVKKSSSDNKYYCTDGARIIVEECDIDNISIKEIRMQRLNEEEYFETMYDIEPSKFGKNINDGKWKLEIVEEFYATEKAFFVGQIRTKESNFWCQIKIYYKNLVYLWNDLRYDCPF